MKILVATGSFKDVYTSLEACKMIKDIIGEHHEVITAPICDGGEYTYDILNSYFTCKKEYAFDVYNPYGRLVSVPYLVFGGEAFVISSEIIRLNPSEEKYKNPLLLSDYGLGQVMLDAIKKGYTKINLCLGGTSTIGFGIGTAQALGVKFYDTDGQLFVTPLIPAEYKKISKMEYNPDFFCGVKLKIINDGITKACDLGTVNPLKIGDPFIEEKEAILNSIDEAFQNVLKITGLMANDAYSGNGGGIYYGVDKLFKAEYLKGADYFCNLFGMDRAMQGCELVITGEGRFDNPHLKKSPIIITELAKRYGKKVLFICGQADKKISGNKEQLKKIGIDQLICCENYYLTHELDKEYENNVIMYREMTPIILKEEFEKLWRTDCSAWTV